MLEKLFVKDKAFYKLILTMALPVVLQNMITIGVNMMDTIMLGSYGEIQISASSLANEFINIFHILCMGMGGGAAVLTSQYWGRKDIPSLKKTVAIMLRICLIIASLFTLGTAFFAKEIMEIYTQEAEVIEKGVLYFRMSLPTYILMGLSLTLTIILRTVRKVKVPLYTSIVAFFVNIFFNWVFIFGKLGAPEMQIEGAALGTVISRVVEAAIIAGYFFFSNKEIGFKLRDIFMPCMDQLKTYLTYSIPVILSDLLLALGNNAMSIIMGHIGTEFVAANAITAVTVRMSTVFNQGLSNASGIITGNTIGSGDHEKAYRQGVTFLCLSVLIGIFAAGIIFSLSEPIINAYEITDSTKTIARALMAAVSIMVIFQAVQSVLTKGVLRNGGDTKFLMIADVVFLWVASIPLGALAGLVWHLDPFWIYILLKIDWILKSILCTWRLVSRQWIRRI